MGIIYQDGYQPVKKHIVKILAIFVTIFVADYTAEILVRYRDT